MSPGAAILTVVEAHVPQGYQSAPTADGVIAALASMNLEGVTTVAVLKEAIAPIRDAALAVVEGQG